jgi:hypothetical protein
MPARSPEELEQLFINRMNAGDLVFLLSRKLTLFAFVALRVPRPAMLRVAACEGAASLDRPNPRHC